MKQNTLLDRTQHYTTTCLCVCVCIKMCTCDTKQCTYIDCLQQKLQYMRIDCMSAFVQISMHQWTCVCECVCFVHVSVWNRAWWVCFDRSELLRSRSAHWRDVPPVNGCSGAWPAWHSFEYRTHPHTHTYPTRLHSIIHTFYNPCFFFRSVWSRKAFCSRDG